MHHLLNESETNMNSSKLFTLAFLASAVLASTAASSQAQTQRVAIPSGISVDPYHPVATCCVPAQKPINTDNSWLVQPPTGPAHNAVPLSSTPYYASPPPGAHWIGNKATDGTYAGVNTAAGGQYTYTTHLCLCGAPPKLPLAVAMSLRVYSDNQFTGYVNAHNIGSSSGPSNFSSGTIISSVNPAFFHAGANVLTFVVTNEPHTPTGLLVFGSISGYFQQPGVPCPRGAPVE